MEQLRAGFSDPPLPARLRCYWWWLNGNTDKPTITHDLEEMKNKGYGGALLVDANGSDQEGNRNVPAGPTFGSPAWTDLFLHALREADRLGLEITLNVQSGWNMGGPAVTPEEASKVMTWTRTTVHGGSRVSVTLPTPPEKNGFYRQIAVLAYPLRDGDRPSASGSALRFRSAAAETGFSMPDSDWMLDPNGSPAGGSGLGRANQEDKVTPHTVQADARRAEVLDLTTQTTAGGSLNWIVPPGEWELLRIGYTDSSTLTCALPCARVSTSSGAWQGLALDYLSRDAFDSFWQQAVEPLLLAAKPYHSLKMLAEDSWELGGTNWTENFREEFKQRRGYDPVPWLPVVAGRILEDPDASLRFLADLRRTVADLVTANHYDRFAERAATFGLGIQAESGGPHGAPIDALETFRHSAVPQSEFWSENPHRSRDAERFFTKEAASAASIYGQRYVAQEGETSIHRQWNESLATDLKPSFDRAITEGMNRLVWHEFTSSPASTGLPGQEYFAGTHLNPKTTWWNAGGAFFQYLDRVQFLMQQGTPVHDVLYFYGDNVPAFVRIKEDDPARVLPGYDYDVTNEDALLRSIHVEGHELVGPSGVRWRVLTMPRSERVSLTALRRIRGLVREGAILAGKPPSSPTGMVSKVQATQFQALVEELWGASCERQPRTVARGQVFCTGETRAVLAALQIPPDLSSRKDTPDAMSSLGGTLDYAHRRVGKMEIYFLRNGSAEQRTDDPIFRVSGKLPEIWDPVSGTIGETPLASGRPAFHTLPDGRLQVHVSLPAYGSVFLVFQPSEDAGAGAVSAFPSVEEAEVERLGAWQVNFPAGHGGPGASLVLNDLRSWTEAPDARVRYFSGSATYRVLVKAPAAAKGKRVWLRFTDVHEIARVRLNGQDAGTVWAKPLTLQVDRWLKPGTNLLEVEVTNLWPNRIIGDLQPETTERYTSTNITSYPANTPLLPSGLIGPVLWQVER